MKIIPITEFDIVFMSYDEPNADSNYYDLLAKAPWAKRVHKVKGFDACHKAAGNIADTERFITVDADNIVRDEFFNIQLDLDLIEKNHTISWAGKNYINGLIYGNGGIKLWSKEVVKNMRTHEAAVKKSSSIEFCWDMDYIQMNNVYSDVYVNASAYQAFRAGFREGVKLLLSRGDVVDKSVIKKQVYNGNIKKCLTWASIGSDVINGLWSMYGTRLGIYMTNINSFDFTVVKDYDWCDAFWVNDIQPKFAGNSEKCIKTGWSYDNRLLSIEIFRLGEILRSQLDLDVAELDPTGSKFFKSTLVNPPRLSPQIREDQVENMILD